MWGTPLVQKSLALAGLLLVQELVQEQGLLVLQHFLAVCCWGRLQFD